ncbi:MAG: alpha-amylase family glycosyl hydrolase [Maribacter sp.]
MATTKQKSVRTTLALGMGAIVQKNKGVTFRVWAPNAEKVSVVGEFNKWNEEKNPLKKEENGYWATQVKDLKPGGEYKYALHTPFGTVMRNDPYAKKMTNSNGNSVVVDTNFKWKNKDFQIDSFNKLVIYELHIGTFNREDKDQEKPGTFKSAEKKLSYLKALGINAIEIMPVAEFAGGISWGYNPASPFSIESDYGTPEEFASLVDTAHGLGIAVIMDVVYNHFGPSDTDLWQFDEWQENDKGGIYFYNDYRSSTPWGDTRPDYGRPEVRRYIRDNAMMWLEEYKCDGLRWDATSYIRYVDGGIGYHTEEIQEAKQMIQDINREIHEKFPGKFLVAEDLKADFKVTTEGYDGLEFDSQWDSEFVHPIKEVLVNTNDADRNMQQVVNAVLFKYNNDVFERIIYTESHDEVANGKARIPEEIQPGEADSEFAKKRSILGAVLVMTSPGIPMIFQGQEFLEDKYFKDTDGLNWDRFSEFKGITKLYRDLIKLRKSDAEDMLKGLQGQKTHFLHYSQENKILAYSRVWDGLEEFPVIVILNFSNTSFEKYEIGIPIAGNFKTLFNSSWEGYDKEDFDTVEDELKISENSPYDNQSHKLTISMAGYGSLILGKDSQID